MAAVVFEWKLSGKNQASFYLWSDLGSFLEFGFTHSLLRNAMEKDFTCWHQNMLLGSFTLQISLPLIYIFCI